MEGGQGISCSSGETAESEPTEAWFEKYSDELCAWYMSIGVSYDEYWYGDYTCLKYYRQAEEYRQERDNEAAWLQGLYVYKAVGCLAPILHAFAKRGTKPEKYPEEPFAVTARQRRLKDEKDQLNAAMEIQNQTMAWLNGMRRKFSGKEKKTNG